MRSKSRTLSLKNYLNKKLQDDVKARQIVVFYDEEAIFKEFISVFRSKDINVIVSEGSFLKIRKEVEEKDPRLERKWLIYIPEPQRAQSWIRDLELAGKVVKYSLFDILKEMLALFHPKESELFHGKKGKLLARSFDIYSDSVSLSSEKDLMKILLMAALETPPGMGDSSIIFKFLEDDTSIGKILDWELEQVFIKYIVELGIKLPEKKEIDLEYVRQTVASVFFISELVKHGILSDELHTDFMPDEISKWSKLFEEWLSSADPQIVKEWGSRVEKIYHLKDKLTGFNIIKIKGLPSIDSLLLEQLEPLLEKDLNDGLIKLLKDIVSERKMTPWARLEGDDYVWQKVGRILELYEICRQCIKEINEQNVKTLEDIFEAYTSRWHKADLAVLRLGKIKDLPEQLEPLKNAALNLYEEYLSLIAEKTAEKVKVMAEKNENWQLRGWKTQKESLFAAISGNSQAAIFLVDALRWDLALILQEKLKTSGLVENIKTQPVLGVVPSETPFGMGSLIPMEGKFDLKVQKGKLIPFLAQKNVSELNNRKKLWKEIFPDVQMLSIHEIKGKNLRGNPVVILSRDIDQDSDRLLVLGTNLFFEILEDIAKSVEQVIKKGIKKVYIFTDHGFLWFPRIENIRRISVPMKEDIVIRHRYLFGDPPFIADTIRIPAKFLGYEDERYFVFPQKLAIFAKGGPEIPFIHGGIMPQEVAIPAIEVTAKVEYIPLNVTLESPKFIETLIPIFRVRTSAPATGNYKKRKIEIRVVDPQDESKILAKTKPFEILEPNKLYRSPKVTLKNPGEYVTIKIVDVETGETLEKKKLKVVLPSRMEDVL